MLGDETLVPGRFLTIISHICVVTTLLWQSQEIFPYCLPNPLIYHQQEGYLQIYHSRLIAGLTTSVVFSVAELIAFMTGLTMFRSGLSLLSIGCHGVASVALTDFALSGALCDWYWWIFAICDVVPFVTNVFVITVALTCR